MKRYVYLRGNLLGGELLADGGAVELDVAVLVPDDAVRDLLGLVVDLGHLAADEPLDGEEGVHGVDDGLALGDLTNKGGLAALHGGDDRVGGAQVNPHHLLVGDL